MCRAASFSVTEPLRDGRQIEIRAIRPSDRDELLAASDRTSDQSLYRRFFGVRRAFSEQEVSAFVNVDFVHEVALVAVMREIERDLVAGGGRYIVVRPGTAEVAFTVVDEFQRQGIASALLRHLVVLARGSGIGQSHRRGDAGQYRNAEYVGAEWLATAAKARERSGAHHTAACLRSQDSI